jgi:DNA adenine methylase
MQYMGGKTRIAKQIAAEIDKVRKPGQLVWDAFCGGLSVSVALSKNGPVLASDACAPLINLYKAVQDGWDPPSVSSVEEYRYAKTLPDTDPLKAFYGFGLSYGGKWFGGYQHQRMNNRGVTYSYAGSCRNSLVRDCKLEVKFEVLDFLSLIPGETNRLLYLDPPYKGTTEFDGVNNFDSPLFVKLVDQWSKFTDIFVSEYEFPLGTCVWERKSTGSSCLAKNDALERLYHIPKQS